MSELYLALPEIFKITSIISISIGFVYCFCSMFFCVDDDESLLTKILCFIPVSFPIILAFWVGFSCLPTFICYIISFFC